LNYYFIEFDSGSVLTLSKHLKYASLRQKL
jgi:hypothetical protein